MTDSFTIEELFATPADTERFYLALGEFVFGFSKVEAQLSYVLWHFADVKPPIAQAVFSGVRIDAAMNYLTRIATATDWPKARKDECQLIFTQLGHINRLRNDILHYGAEFVGKPTPSGVTENLWEVSNRRVAHIPAGIRTLRITPETLHEATADLDKIWYHLVALTWSEDDVITAKRKVPWYVEAISRAWHYKAK